MVSRIIHQSPAFGIPPVVTGPQIRPQVAAELQAILLEMNTDPTWRAALTAVGIDRFVVVSDAI